VYHGGGGFIHSEIYNMPTWMRTFHIQKINEYNKKQDEEYNKTKNKGDNSPSKVSSPNVKPSSYYNIKK
tara:strand:- start:548 stop:754 length:207 start_codon:yes stop_codon:yes gene_type:complete